MRTFSAKASEVKREWWLVDASGMTLGRLASVVAQLLRGKHKPIYTPHVDTGDFVVIINAEKVRVTGRKAEQKVYYSHSGYLGGLKRKTYTQMMSKHPEEIIRRAVRGMIPHNRLGRQVIKKLKVYSGSEHPHQAQAPKPYQIRKRGERNSA